MVSLEVTVDAVRDMADAVQSTRLETHAVLCERLELVTLPWCYLAAPSTAEM